MFASEVYLHNGLLRLQYVCPCDILPAMCKAEQLGSPGGWRLFRRTLDSCQGWGLHPNFRKVSMTPVCSRDGACSCVLSDSATQRGSQSSEDSSSCNAQAESLAAMPFSNCCRLFFSYSLLRTFMSHLLATWHPWWLVAFEISM